MRQRRNNQLEVDRNYLLQNNMSPTQLQPYVLDTKMSQLEQAREKRQREFLAHLHHKQQTYLESFVH